MAYGKNGLPVEFPDTWDVNVVRRPPMPVLPDPAAALRRALADPVGCDSLIAEARGCSSACIAICDITRPVPNDVILPVVLRELLQAGIPLDGITVLVATGLHRPNEGDELSELIGDPWVVDEFRVENHFAVNDADHTKLGITSRGTEVLIDRRFVEADLKIVVGLVEPHFMAGYSGGRKVVTPGLAHQTTIRALHSARFLEDANVNCGVLAGNPLHEEQIEIVRMLGRVLAVNTVTEDRHRMSFVNFGEVEVSHLAAVDYARKYVEVPVLGRYGTVVTSAAGYPLDKTYYQTVKGMVGAMDLLAPGGDLFIVSECSEGLGSPHYRIAQQRLITAGVEGFASQLLARQYAEVDEWQTEMQLKPMRTGSIHLYSDGLTEEDKALTGVNCVDDLGPAIRRSVERSADHSIAVVPEGPYVLPVPESRNGGCL